MPFGTHSEFIHAGVISGLQPSPMSLPGHTVAEGEGMPADTRRVSETVHMTACCACECMRLCVLLSTCVAEEMLCSSLGDMNESQHVRACVRVSCRLHVAAGPQAVAGRM